jgi:hypothetical protein
MLLFMALAMIRFFDQRKSPEFIVAEDPNRANA